MTLRLWTIYEHPSDYPDSYVVREWRSSPGSVSAVDHVELADTLSEARALVPEGLYRLERADSDDATIVETWI